MGCRRDAGFEIKQTRVFTSIENAACYSKFFANNLVQGMPTCLLGYQCADTKKTNVRRFALNRSAFLRSWVQAWYFSICFKEEFVPRVIIEISEPPQEGFKSKQQLFLLAMDNGRHVGVRRKWCTVIQQTQLAASAIPVTNEYTCRIVSQARKIKKSHNWDKGDIITNGGVDPL